MMTGSELHAVVKDEGQTFHESENKLEKKVKQKTNVSTWLPW